jgi:hypothetical protein
MSKLIVNCETNEITERELNDEEIAQQEIDAAAFEIIRNVEADKANAKAALLERLGITAEEAALLLG